LKQKDLKLEASLGYIARLCLKKEGEKGVGWGGGKERGGVERRRRRSKSFFPYHTLLYRKETTSLIDNFDKSPGIPYDGTNSANPFCELNKQTKTVGLY
jgi:hypothetical protein